MTTEITKIIKGFKNFSETPYDDSIKFLKEYLEVEENDEAFFELGKALFFKGNYNESIRYLKKSSNFKTNAYLGLNHYRKEDYSNAIEHFNKFLNENTNETILTYLMIACEKNCDWEDAIECGKRLLDMNPNNYSIKCRLIDYHFNLKEYEKSLNYINELKCKKLRYKKGLVLFNLKRYEEAVKELKNLKTLEAYKLISKSYENLNKPGKAITYLMKVYEKDPNIEILFEASEISFKNGSPQNSINILEGVLMEDPKNERALEKMARNYLELQKFELAIIYCEELLKVNEGNFNAYLILSETYPYLDNNEKSLEFAENGLKINPKSADLWTARAWALYPLDFEEFVRSYEHALKLEPNNTENYTKLIWHCALEDRQDYAHKYYDKLLFYNPAFAKSFEEVTKYANI